MQWVFAIRVGALPNARWHPIRRRRIIRALNNLPGIMDFCELSDDGSTLIILGTRTHAEKALEAIKAAGDPVQDEVFLCQADFELKEIHVRGPVDEVCMDG